MRGPFSIHTEWRTVLVRVLRGLLLVLIAGFVVSCAADQDAERRVDATVDAAPHTSGECGAGFVSVDLPHTTKGPGDTASTFDGTGAGVAVGDLDADGDLDLVLPNLSGATSLLENVGGGQWAPHDLFVGRFRGANIVDLEGDGDLDIVLSTGLGPPVAFRNLGSGPFSTRFIRGQLDDVKAATYAMAWGDLGGDGDLDLITGSYNAELSIIRNSPVIGSDTGVILHETTDTGVVVTRLSPVAQALALIVTDIDGDQRDDILVGNDLATADMVFAERGDRWERLVPFAMTSYSTMSYDAADLNGDGRTELLSTDMAPMSETVDDRYRNVLEDLEAAPRPDNIQTPENALLRVDANGEWVNDGRDLGVDATGWSWSGLFGDLDNDGSQDVFIVNGMRSDQLFDFLPDARLVEPNQAFRNVDGTLISAPEWNLGDTAGGRGAMLFDQDRDGDLDIVINNLDQPSRLFENRTCGGLGLTAELRWPGTGNTRAIGAQVSVQVDEAQQTRNVATSRGYLSSAPPEVHFGLRDTPTVDVQVRWPDGAVSTLGEVQTGQHLIITRDE